MTLVPAVPDTDLGPEVRLGPDTLDLPAFLEISRQHGSGLLYLQAAPFAPADDEPPGSGPARAPGQAHGADR